MEASDIVKLIILLIAMLASALFSATEAAFLSMQRGKLAALTLSNPKQARKVERFASNPEKLLSTVLTGNNLANTGVAAVGTSLALSFLSSNAAVIASTVVVTVLLLVFSEAIPKTIATRHSIGLATLMSTPLRVVELVLLPAIWTLERVVRGVTRLLGLPGAHLVSQEDIIALVHEGRTTGTVEPSQAEMLGNVFRVEDRQLKEVMTPRTEIVGLRKGATLDEFYQLYRRQPHAHYPVYEGNLDHIIGILSLKDLVHEFAYGGIQPGDDVTRLAQPPYILPETRLLGEHLRQLQVTGHQLAILADEYGGTAGLVTLKEMVEEIVGPLGEPDGDEIQAMGSGMYQVDGGMDIDAANKLLGLGIPDGDYETLAGFILTRLGVIPKEGDQFQHKQFVLEVTDMQGVKIEQVTVTGVVGTEENLA
ncbi:MAG TPA: hemolysin family protein [Dehalococcoidia bacterium]|nr:hemolysin family protein [Dehalococcoidia bacterium]